jgi:hypothetical protein
MAMNPPETAPKDRTILVDCGYPWLCVAIWSEYAEKWCIAEIQYNECDGKADPWWINESETEINGWIPLEHCK